MDSFLDVLLHLWLYLHLLLLSKIHVVHCESLFWVLRLSHLLLHQLLLEQLLVLSIVLRWMLLLLLLIVEFGLEVGQARLLHGALLLLLSIRVVLHHLDVEVMLLLIFALGLLVWLVLLHHLSPRLILVHLTQLLHSLSCLSVKRIFLVGSNLVKRLSFGFGILVGASWGLLVELVDGLLVVNMFETCHLMGNPWHFLLLLVTNVELLDLLLTLVLVLLRNVQNWLIHLPLGYWLLTLLLSSEFLLDLQQTECLALLLRHLLLRAGMLREILFHLLLILGILLEDRSWLLARLRLDGLLRDVWLNDTRDFVEFVLDLLVLREELSVLGLLWSRGDGIVVLSRNVWCNVQAAVVGIDL
jgi:hypothetical protein